VLLHLFGLVRVLVGGAVPSRRRLGLSLARRPHADRPATARDCARRLRGCCSSPVAALESLRFYSVRATLPDVPGGIVGNALAGVASGTFGFHRRDARPAYAGRDRIQPVHRESPGLRSPRLTGLLLEGAFALVRRIWEQRRDRKLGEIAREERDFVVEAEKRREEDHPPLVIAPPPPEIKKSERVQKEKQAPLFEELPDTPLPPIKLLDEAVQQDEQVSAETLEYTSRLIEKKLSDFGVAVKVLAAYPGPVITRYEVEPAVGVKGSQIVNLVKDLARALSVVAIRVVETIPASRAWASRSRIRTGRPCASSEILGSEAYHSAHSQLALALGKDIAAIR
jgi:S-DNA-T family DNA segregation ATPase FtsK/SpoIIIE